jgi:hypothetical protein
MKYSGGAWKKGKYTASLLYQPLAVDILFIHAPPEYFIMPSFKP